MIAHIVDAFLGASFHPYQKIGGIFSVALSVELPRPAFHRRVALWSPDVPRIH
jgi:hypothetical protein